jgi:hypothetical protein
LRGEALCLLLRQFVGADRLLGQTLLLRLVRKTLLLETLLFSSLRSQKRSQRSLALSSQRSLALRFLTSLLFGLSRRSSSLLLENALFLCDASALRFFFCQQLA